MKAAAWWQGTPEKLSPLPKEGLTSSTDGDFATATVKLRGSTAFGLASSKKGGELTLGFSAEPASFERVRKVLLGMLK